jgi:hypothetical protein
MMVGNWSIVHIGFKVDFFINGSLKCWTDTWIRQKQQNDEGGEKKSFWEVQRVDLKSDTNTMTDKYTNTNT